MSTSLPVGTETMAAVTLVLVTEAGAGADRAGWRKLGRDGRDIFSVWMFSVVRDLLC